MAVLAHEGEYNILYRSYGLPVGSAFADGYLARPDRVGRYPVVLVIPDLRRPCPGSLPRSRARQVGDSR